MNILFLMNQSYPCRIGGVELFHFHLMKALSRDHDVWMSTTCPRPDGLDRVRVRTYRQRGLLSSKFSRLIAHARILFRLRRWVDVVQIPYTSNSWFSGVYVPFLCRLLRIPYVLSIHGGAMRPWKPKYFHRRLFEEAADLITVSDVMQKEYSRRSGRFIHIIPPLLPFNRTQRPPDELKRAYGYRESDRIILAVGTVKRIKAPDLLVEAFLDLGEEFIERNRLRLLLVGGGPLLDDLRRRVERDGLSERIRLQGAVEHSRVCEFFGLAEIFAIPSFFEATPVALLEAMFNRKPIVGSDIGGITQLIRDGENGLIVPIGDVPALREALRKLVLDRDLAERMAARAGSDYKDTFQFDDVVKAHLEIYRKVCERRNK